VHVLQGEREMARDSRTLGRFHLVGIPPAPRGVPQIEVTFDIDANGILNVSAKDMATGKEQRITISGTGTLAKDEIDKMVKEAGEHAEEDKRRREEIESRNTADSRVYQIEKLLEENKDKVSPDDDRAIRAAIEEVRKALSGGSKDAVDAALKDLDRASHKLAEHLYQKGTSGSAGGPGGPAGDGGAPPDSGAPGDSSGEAKKGDVIDAEYVDVDEGKR
jgi:molecular chaperone DnaK